MKSSDIPRLLVVDDEPNIVFSVRECLASPSLQVLSAATAREGIELVRAQKPDVVILDVRLPDLSGLDAYAKIREIDPRLPCIIMTAYARTETAIEAMRRGAYEYLVKPVDVQRLREVVGNALKVSRLNLVPALVETSTDDETAADCIVGTAPAMQEVYKAIGRIAPQDSTVLIQGESGTGKELVARAIYHYSRRSQMPFLAINCAALPETLLESELFGHERGAFTGAEQRRIGKFEQMHGGTIFLDEIGDMSPATQAKALRLLQEQRFQRLGGNDSVETNVRIIAATNRNLDEMVEAGSFRQDLFYRLNGFTIRLPPLRQRIEDISVLAEHFIRRLNRELDRQVATITPEARAALSAWHWPGNIRELESAIRYAVVHAVGDVVTEDCLPASCRGAIGGEAPEATGRKAVFDLLGFVETMLRQQSPEIYSAVTSQVDRLVLPAVLEWTGGNQVQAASLLGISRMTLRSKLRALAEGSPPDSDADAPDQ